MSNLFRDHVMNINGTTLAGSVSKDLSRGIAISAPLTDGNVNATHTAITAANPRHTIRTLDIDTAVTICGTQGGLIAGNCDWYDALIATTGGFKASGIVHTKGNYGSAYCIPSSLTVGAQSVAEFAFDLVGIGVGDPVTITEDQALAGTEGTPKQYGLGPLEINGTTYKQITDVNIDFGVTEAMDMSDGNIGPRDIKTQSALPSITFTTTDMELIQSLVDTGLALDGTNGFVVYFRQRSQDGTAYLAGTNHIEIEVLAGMITPESTTGNEGKSATFRVTPKAGSQNPIVITTGVALPA